MAFALYKKKKWNTFSLFFELNGTLMDGENVAFQCMHEHICTLYTDICICLVLFSKTRIFICIAKSKNSRKISYLALEKNTIQSKCSFFFFRSFEKWFKMKFGDLYKKWHYFFAHRLWWHLFHIVNTEITISLFASVKDPCYARTKLFLKLYCAK